MRLTSEKASYSPKGLSELLCITSAAATTLSRDWSTAAGWSLSTQNRDILLSKRRPIPKDTSTFTFKIHGGAIQIQNALD